MNERLKKLRKAEEINLTQREFGLRLGVKDTAISKIEKGENGLTDQMILAICREFSANEEWLRTGEGEMFVESDDTIVSAVAEEFGLDELSKIILTSYVEMDSKKRVAFNSFIKELSNMVMQENIDNARNDILDMIEDSHAVELVRAEMKAKTMRLFNKNFPYIGIGNVDSQDEVIGKTIDIYRAADSQSHTEHEVVSTSQSKIDKFKKLPIVTKKEDF